MNDVEFKMKDDRCKPVCFGKYVLSGDTSKCSNCDFRILCKIESRNKSNDGCEKE